MECEKTLSFSTIQYQNQIFSFTVHNHQNNFVLLPPQFFSLIYFLQVYQSIFVDDEQKERYKKDDFDKKTDSDEYKCLRLCDHDILSITGKEVTRILFYYNPWTDVEEEKYIVILKRCYFQKFDAFTLYDSDLFPSIVLSRDFDLPSLLSLVYRNGS